MTLQDTANKKIEVTNWDFSDTHFEGQFLAGKLKGRVMLFLKSRPYSVLAK